MKKIMLFMIISSILVSCASSGAPSAIAPEPVNVTSNVLSSIQPEKIDVTDPESLRDALTMLKAAIDEANMRNDALTSEISHINESVTQLQTEVAYQGNTLAVLQQTNRAPSSGPYPSLDTADGSAPIVIQGGAGSSKINVVDDVDSIRSNLYNTAYKLYRNGNSAESIKLFRDFIKNMPNDDLADNAQYWIGENYYKMKDYSNALNAFQTVITKYPKKGKVPDAMLKIGYTYRNLGQNAKASEALNELITKYPRSEAANLARQTVSKWK